MYLDYAKVYNNHGDVEREGRIKNWEVPNNGTVNITFDDGTIIKTGVNNAILFGKED